MQYKTFIFYLTSFRLEKPHFIIKIFMRKIIILIKQKYFKYNFEKLKYILYSFLNN
jgi:hypothetical protein